MRMALLMVAFLFLKTGEKFATQETAGPTVAAFTEAVSGQLDNVKFAPQIYNQPSQAVEFVTTKKPAVGIVTPGFYLAYAKALGMTPLLAVERQGVTRERYVVVVLKTESGDEGLSVLKGKVLATTLADEERFLKSVILQDQPGELRLRKVDDVEVAAYDIADQFKDAPDGVLIEEATWKALAADEELGPKLKVIYQSPDVPPPLVVSFEANLHKFDIGKFVEILQGLHQTEKGREALALIRVTRFQKLDTDQLQAAKERFHGR